MKKLFFLTVSAFLLSSFHCSSQDDANAGIIIDGVKVDKIDCWSFEKMDLVFPINKEKWEQYDLVVVSLICGQYTEFRRGFTKQKATEYFGNATYGVWKFLRDKATDAQECTSAGYVPLTRKAFAYSSGSWETAYLVVGGFVQLSTDAYGNASYSDAVTLYKSNVVSLVKSKYKADLPCTPSGTKLDLTIEPAGGYDEEFGVIK